MNRGFQRVVILTILLSFFIAPTLLFTRDENLIKQKFNAADNLTAVQDYDRAVVLFRELVQLDTGNSHFNFKLAEAMIESNSTQDPLPFLEVAIRDVSDKYKSNYKQRSAPTMAWLLAARELHEHYRFAEALSYFEKYLPIAEDDGNPEDITDIKRSIEYCKNGIELSKNPIRVKFLDFAFTTAVPNAAHSPVFSPDEGIYVFTADSRPDKEVVGLTEISYNDDIYITYFKNGKWTPAEPLSENVNSKKHEASVGISPDGKQMLVFRDDSGDGNLYYSDLIGENEWGKLKKFPEPINSSAQESHATLSEDGRTIYFTSDRKGGYGGLDVYMCKKNEKGQWSKRAINLGPALNTKWHEESPHIQAGSNILYFSSDRPKSMGGFDIYRCQLEHDSVPTRLINLGYPINTPQNDLFFKTSLDGRRAYYSTPTRASKGEYSLKTIEFRDFKLFPNVRVRGLVLNDKKDTLRTVNSSLFNIQKRDIVDSCITDQQSGYYYFKLNSENTFFASFEYDDYVYFSRPFHIEKYFTQLSFSNLITLDPIVLSDTSFRQSLAGFKISKRQISQGSYAAADSSNLFVKINKQKVAEVSRSKTEVKLQQEIGTKMATRRLASIQSPSVQIQEIVPIIPINAPIKPLTKAEINKLTLADSLKLLGIAHYNKKEYISAVEKLERALNLYEELKDDTNVLVCMNYLALALYDAGRFEDALSYHKQAVAMMQKHNKSYGLDDKYQQMGDLYNRMFDKEDALFYLSEALALRKKSGDKTGQIETLNSLADMHFDNKDFDKSIAYLRELTRMSQNDSALGATYNKIGVSYHKKSQYEIAIENYETAVDYAVRANDKKGQSIYLNNIGNAKYDLGQFEDAISFYEKSLKIKRTINYEDGIAITLHNMGNVYQKKSQWKQATAYYTQSLAIAEKLGMSDLQAQNHFEFMHVYHAMDDYRNALVHYKKYVAIQAPELAGKRNIQFAQQSYKYEISQKDIVMLRRMMQAQKAVAMKEAQRRAAAIELLAHERKLQLIFKAIIIAAGVAAVIILLLILWRRKEAKQQKTQLEAQKAEITQNYEEINTQKDDLEAKQTELVKLSIVAEQTTNGVAILDSKANFEYINSGYKKMFGVTMEDLNTQTSKSILTLFNDINVREQINECIENKQSISFDSPRRRSNNQPLWTHTSLTPVVVDNQLYKIILIDSDISEIKIAEMEIKLQRDEITDQRNEIEKQRDVAVAQKDEIEAQKDQIESGITELKKAQQKLIEAEKMASLGSIVANVAHRINTPIGICIAATSTMATKSAAFTQLFEQKQMKQSDLTNYLSSAKDAATLLQMNLLRTGELVKSFKRISVDKVSEKKRTIDLGQYLPEILRGLDVDWNQKTVQVNMTCPSISMTTYPGYLVEIFNNFVLNVIQFAFKDKAEGVIDIAVTELDGRVQIVFADNGCGMAPDVVKRCFDPFFSTNSMQQNSGLGLNFVYNYVTQTFKGDITCESELGKGTRFIINIPIVVEPEEEIA